MRDANTYRAARRHSAKKWKYETNLKRRKAYADGEPVGPRMNFREAWNLTQKAAAMQLSHQRKYGK